MNAEYVLWWLREGRLPPTLMTNSTGLLKAAGPRKPSTATIAWKRGTATGSTDFELTAAYWFDDAQSLGVEGRGFILERDSTYF